MHRFKGKGRVNSVIIYVITEMNYRYYYMQAFKKIPCKIKYVHNKCILSNF